MTKPGSRADIAQRPLGESPEKIAQILEEYGDTLDRTRTALNCGVTIWTVRKILANLPPEFRTNLLKDDIFETGHACLKLIREKLPLIPDREIGSLALQFRQLMEAGNLIDGKAKIGTAIQNIINISKDEESKLRQTIEARVDSDPGSD